MPIHILVIDDLFMERRRLTHLIRRGIPDAIVTFGTNGCSALETISVLTPDVIISDMRMPEMNGLEFVKKLRANDNSIPVILMTSFGSEKLAVEALLAGASSYVPKLELESRLIETIHDMLAISQKRQNRRRVISSLVACEFCYTIENDPKLVSPLISHLLDQIIAMKLLSPQQITRVGVAVQEAVSNAMHHGNLELDTELRQVDEQLYYSLAAERRESFPYASRRVSIVAKLSQSEVRFRVMDDGKGFDSASILDVEKEIRMDRIGGRGLLLIKNFMDEVSFNSRGNEITMAMRCVLPDFSDSAETKPGANSEQGGENSPKPYMNLASAIQS